MKLVRGFFLLAAVLVVMSGGTVFAETMIAHYEFNETVGTIDNFVDSSGNGHTLIQHRDGGGTVVYDAELDSNVLYNPNGSGYMMDPGTAGSLDFAAGTSFTLAGWFKQTGRDHAYSLTTSDSLYTYAIHLGTNGSEPICSLGFLDDGTIVSYVETDYGDAVGNSNLDQITITSASPALALDTNGAFDGWHHVALVLDRSVDKVSMYLDGVELDTVVLDQESPVATHTDGDISHLSDSYGFSFDTGTSTSQEGGVAGYYNDPDRDWIGYLDDVRFCEGALSASQVAELAGVQVPEPGTILLILSGALGLLFLRRK